MLSGVQVASYFNDNNLEVNADNKKVIKVTLPNGIVLYVKKGVADKPLVLPPSQLKNQSSINAIDHLSVNWGGVHNDNFAGYGKKLKNGKSESHYGYDADVMDESALDQLLKLLSPAYVKSSRNLFDEVSDCGLTTPSDTTQKALRNSRIGQGKYRLDLIGLWGSCAVTGASTLQMLKASHVKPWTDSDNIERLDKFNGLLLSANLDSAFDCGLISFQDSGEIIISSAFTEAEMFSIHPEMTLRQVFQENKPYLAYHRKNVFQG